MFLLMLLPAFRKCKVKLWAYVFDRSKLIFPQLFPLYNQKHTRSKELNHSKLVPKCIINKLHTDHKPESCSCTSTAIVIAVCSSFTLSKYSARDRLHLDCVNHICDFFHSLEKNGGVRGGTVERGTALQGGRSRVRFQMVSLEFFIDIILPAAL